MTIRRSLRVSLYLALGLAVAVAGLLGAFALEFSPSREIVYRELGDVRLELQLFEPADSHAGLRPGILFFFGGGWTGGSSIQFYPWADYFASQGWIGMTVDYRVYSRHGTKARDALEDARAAFRFVVENAEQLGLDPSRVFLAGGSAGGHLAAATAITPWSERGGLIDPAGLVLLNPALDTRAVGEDHYLASVKDLLFGEDGEAISPLHHVRPGLPPTLVAHGTADGIVPFAHSRNFCEQMNAAGNTCRLLPYEDAHHGFFNWGFGRFDEVIVEVAAFLAPLR
ncbi:MAG: alpha/beta hydrolase [bacterium]|nr:alpha/beta hydrolase [bacterium]